MDDPIEKLRKKIKENLVAKETDWKDKVYNSQQYQQEIKNINKISINFVRALRYISIYSSRAKYIYNEFLCIMAIDDLIQSSIGIHSMIENGIYNTVKRELRYLIEMIAKYVIVDYAKMGCDLVIKLDYLKKDIPNSSIQIVEEYSTPFTNNLKVQFRSEIKDFFYKSCAYVHPSKKQMEEQLTNYKKGNNIGFESAEMFSNVNRLVFRAYDMILTMVFHSFGHSMSKDIFEQVLNDEKNWKYHKGKYMKEYIKTLNL